MALIKAVKDGNLSAVRSALADGIDSDSISKALRRAAENGHVDTA